jgi:hypothetical protein
MTYIPASPTLPGSLPTPLWCTLPNPISVSLLSPFPPPALSLSPDNGSDDHHTMVPTVMAAAMTPHHDNDGEHNGSDNGGNEAVTMAEWQ